MIDQIIDYNKTFVEQKGYEKYLTSKYPDKKLAVLESWCSPLSCMDTRLTELLPVALGLKNGDAKIIKNAGGLVISAFDSAMRSLIVAISVRKTVSTSLRTTNYYISSLSAIRTNSPKPSPAMSRR